MEKSHKIIIALSIFLVIGYVWSLDMPLALEVPLRQEPYNFSNFEYNFLYFATFAAIFLSDMPVGMLLDKYPIKRTVLCICFISLFSQVAILFTFYFQFPGYKVFLYIFRGIFGITGEGLFTIQALLISLYGGKYYDRLLGLGICFPFLFDSINNILTPYMFDSTHSMELVWGVGIVFCAIALICALMISKLVGQEEKLKQENEKDLIKKQEQEEPLSFRGLKEMPRQFWVIVGAVFFTEYVIGGYIDNLNDTIVKRFNISYVNAGYMMFIPYGAASIISYLLGMLVERKPKSRRILMFSSTVLYSIGLLAMYYLPNITEDDETPSFHYVVIGFQFLTVSYLLSILYGVLSSSIVYIVSSKHLGIAWGVIGSTIGFSEATSPLIIASILESEQALSDGYQKLTLFLFFASLFALAFSVWILMGSFEKIDVNSSQNIETESTLQESLLQGQQKIETQESKIEEHRNLKDENQEERIENEILRQV